MVVRFLFYFKFDTKRGAASLQSGNVNAKNNVSAHIAKGRNKVMMRKITELEITSVD